MFQQERPPEPPDGVQKGPRGAPYEEALNKAFDKLTSQILIFLLAYTVLIVGLSVLVRDIPTSVRLVLYVIPPLGVFAYGWSRRRHLHQGVKVSARVVKDQAGVYGERGAPATGASGNVRVSAGWSSGKARVVGREYSGVTDASAEDVESQHLLEVFRQLGADDRRQLLIHAMRILTPGVSPHRREPS